MTTPAFPLETTAELLQQYHSFSNIQILLHTPWLGENKMRKYILTESERHIAKRYLKKGEKLDGYRTLLTRCRHMKTVQENADLITQLLEAAKA